LQPVAYRRARIGGVKLADKTGYRNYRSLERVFQSTLCLILGAYCQQRAKLIAYRSVLRALDDVMLSTVSSHVKSTEHYYNTRNLFSDHLTYLSTNNDSKYLVNNLFKKSSPGGKQLRSVPLDDEMGLQFSHL